MQMIAAAIQNHETRFVLIRRWVFIYKEGVAWSFFQKGNLSLRIIIHLGIHIKRKGK